MKASVFTNKAVKQKWKPLKEVEKVSISAENIRCIKISISKTKIGRQKIA